MPVITIGENTGNSYTGCEDSEIQVNNSTNNYGGSLTQAFGSNDYIFWEVLIKFSGISNIPAGATINSASLFIYSTTIDDVQFTAVMRRVLRDWVEGTQTGADRQLDTPDSCCWDEYGSGNAWTSAGCLGNGTDRISDTSGSGTISTSEGYKEIVLNAQGLTDIANFRSGAYNNYGWLITHSTVPASNERSMITFSEGTDANRPYLSVNYTESGGSVVPQAYYYMN
jgi:hypothetical protein